MADKTQHEADCSAGWPKRR